MHIICCTTCFVVLCSCLFDFECSCSLYSLYRLQMPFFILLSHFLENSAKNSIKQIEIQLFLVLDG